VLSGRTGVGFGIPQLIHVKRNPLLLLLGLSAAGLASGYVAKRVAGPASPAVVASDGASPAGTPDKRGTTATASPATAAVLKSISQSTIRSTDTLEIAKTLEGPDAYHRLALWMVDASEPEIAAYWQHYRQQKSRSNEITDLIFINWTRIDPRAATTAAKGTGDEHYAWWAWACHDPKTALETAIAENPDRVNNVTWGIGEFHKDWLREHFDELPEGARNNALQGMAKWDDGENPLDTLNFLKEKGYGFHPGIFNVLIRKDPWAAYDWIEENGSSARSQYGGSFDAMSTFVETVGEQYPDVLKRIADQAPSGEMKRKLEAVLFANLLKTDPEAAIVQAEETKAPVIAAQRMAAAALSLVRKEPERAFELAGKIFAANPDALSGMTMVEYAGGSSGWGSGDQQVSELMDALLIQDPARVMELKFAEDQGHRHNSPFAQLASKWAEQDINGLSEWVNRQDDPKVREPAAAVIVNKLSNEQQYEDAAGWAMSLGDSKIAHVQNVLATWRQSNPDEALQWLDNSQLPEADRNQIKTSLGLQP
jgi:hypothetical protein